jgi:hypothetical protein
VSGKEVGKTNPEKKIYAPFPAESGQRPEIRAKGRRGKGAAEADAVS